MSHIADINRDAIVIRFRPTNPEAVLASAQKEFIRVGHHGASCFASLAEAGQTQGDVEGRLLRVAELDSVRMSGNRRFFVCTRAERITTMGFSFLKDDEAGEAEEHYCVDLGPTPTLEDVTRFLSAFEPRATAAAAQ